MDVNVEQLSHPTDTALQRINLCVKEPERFLNRLDTLWSRQKGHIVENDSEIIAIITTLALLFRNNTGVLSEIHARVQPPDSDVNAWNACIVANFPITLLDMITNDLLFEQPYAWVSSVILLNVAIARTWTLSAHPRGLQSDFSTWPAPPQEMADEYLSKIGPVWDIIWRERDIVLYQSKPPWPCIIHIAAVIEFAYAVTLLHTQLYPERQKLLLDFPSIMKVALGAWTWVATSSNPEEWVDARQQSYAFEIVKTFHDSTVMLLDERAAVSTWRLASDPVIDAVGPLKFMRACCSALLAWPVMVGDNLAYCMEAVERTVVLYSTANDGVLTDSDFQLRSRRAYWDVPMLNALAEALERNFRVPSPELAFIYSPESNVYLCCAVCGLLCTTLEGLVFCGNHPPVADGRSIYKILSYCLRIIRDNIEVKGEQIQVPLESFTIQAFSKACTKTISMCGGNYPQTAIQRSALRRIVQGLLVAARDSWYSDMHLLRSQRHQSSGNSVYETVVRLWTLLGEALGLVETVERDKADNHSKQMCAWAECLFFAQPCPTPLSSCAGCKERKYCSRECQKSDWKRGGHREKCRRLDA